MFIFSVCWLVIFETLTAKLKIENKTGNAHNSIVCLNRARAKNLNKQFKSINVTKSSN